MTNPSPLFTTTTPPDLHSTTDTILEHLALTEGLIYRQKVTRVLRPQAVLADLPSGYTTIADIIFGNEFHNKIVRHPNGSLIEVGLAANKGFTANVAAATAEARHEVLVDLALAFPAREIAPDKEEVFVDFWSLTPQGARSLQRTIAIAPWERVADNYAPLTQTGLTSLMTGFKPTKAGQLVLWYGPPGTGKTHALRALCWEWRKWCTFHYITDPEVFFGASAQYMLDVLLMRGGSPVGPYEDDDPQPTSSNKWRLLILEDSGELMVPDAKVQAGQGLSRLLNVVDGLIGQGLRIMVLVTTNEILKKLHPAVARPGRCAARIEFSEFPRAEARAWLQTKGYEAEGLELSQTASLAELYSKIGTEQTIVESKSLPVGFNS